MAIQRLYIARTLLLSLAAFVFNFSLSAAAQSIDSELLDRLHEVSGKEQLRVADKVRLGLKDMRLSPALQTKLVETIANSHNLAKYGYVEMLSSLAPGHALEPGTITAIAAALNSNVNHRPAGEDVLSALLISYEEKYRLPKKVVQHLFDALNTNNVLPAIAVLRAMPAEPPRFLPNVEALTKLLLHEYPYVRTNAIRALGHYGRTVVLPEATREALVSVSDKDSLMHVRFEAFTALSDQAGVNRSVLARSLAAQLTQPGRELWRASSGYTGYGNLESRAIQLLVRWFEAPLPSFVIDTLIAKSNRFYDVTRPFLKQVAESQGFTATQIEALQVVAERHQRPATRQALYGLMQTEINANQEAVPAIPAYEAALIEMAQGTALSKRIQAAYRLEQQYSAMPVPMSIASVATDVLFESNDRELRAISARLVANSDQPFADREETLHRALATYSSDDAIRAAWFSMYPTNELEALVTNDLLNQQLPPWVFTTAVHELHRYVRASVSLRELHPDTVDSLMHGAKQRNHYSSTAAVISLLDTCYIEIPLTLRMYSKSFQSGVLSSVFFFLAATFLILGTVTFLSLTSVPLRGATGRKRFGLLLCWGVVLLAGLALFAGAMIGFLGHNSAPDPSSTLQFNKPMYVGMVFIIAIAVVELRWAKRLKA